jgi:hypothetical protein
VEDDEREDADEGARSQTLSVPNFQSAPPILAPANPVPSEVKAL